MMELDEAIKHCEDKAKELRKEKHIMAVTGREQEWADCLQCAEEHEQLAKWLTDYKRLKALEDRPTGKWIPVSERLPQYSGLYIVSVDDVVLTANFDGKYFSHVGGGLMQVYAWMPLPQPYKEEAENETN